MYRKPRPSARTFANVSIATCTVIDSASESLAPLIVISASLDCSNSPWGRSPLFDANYYLIQRIEIDGLDRGSVKAGRRCPLFVFGTPVAAECYNRNRRVRGLNALNDLVSTDSWKADIEQDKVGLK